MQQRVSTQGACDNFDKMAPEKGRLETWLSKHFSGKKLELAIQLCEEGLVDSVQDLREPCLSKSLHEVFSQAGNAEK